ncbi:DNA-binding transcriptional regulator [Vibrio sp. JC009]|uniref:helix-turn-helix domain-containing protein n=1 Tax=Vibrio sp. JC009 TaxID=2912314 RepID=UPI0023B0AD09|nr:DNA-binding transcriptional regulator [Vibrio sp. JC009]WED22474.1 DNA-binding transcriptional regulator [Vibrio sp. JC009]
MSDILNTVYETAQDLHKNGEMDKTTLRKFDAICLTPVHEFSADEVKSLRVRFNLSQAVLAEYLNVSTKLVQKWEQNVSHPKGAALKLLTLAEKKGIDVIA